MRPLMAESAPKGALSWDEINRGLRSAAEGQRKIAGRKFADGIMYAHQCLYSRALRVGSTKPSPPPQRADVYDAMTTALHPVRWQYLGNADPVSEVLGTMRALGFEFVRTIDPRTIEVRDAKLIEGDTP